MAGLKDQNDMINDFYVTADQSKFDFNKIYQFISKSSYWAEGIPMMVLKKSISNSLSFALFYKEQQIGIARVVTDYATFGYLADVFIDPEFRGKGLSKLLMNFIMSYPQLQGLRRWMLATRDAHDLYEKYGFKLLEKPERIMELVDKDIYTRSPHQID